MDNFNALSKSAILTKLALDGYFIDLLTLNSFIKEWQIEAIYENEFGVEFFDNTSYETILNRLKEKYSKAKEEAKNTSLQETVPEAIKQTVSCEPSADIQADTDVNDTVSLDELAKANNEPQNSFIQQENAEPETLETETVSLDDIQKATENASNLQAQGDFAVCEPEVIENTAKEPVVQIRAHKTRETIMPRAMKRLTPSPVSPLTSLNLNHSYMEEDVQDVEEFAEDYVEEYIGEDILVNESFTPEEIEKADKLINNTLEAKDNNEKEPEKIPQKTESNKDAKGERDELDLMQLAQTFAQNLTGGPANTKDVPPADLEEIFSGSYTEPFEDLQDYVTEEGEEEATEYQPEEYKSLQEDIPSELVVPEVQPNISLMPKEMNTSNLTAQDIREIIRDEISRQTANIVPKPQNGEDMREIIREIVKQATEIAPQNAFKLDISHGTLDMIAKSIAKKIAVKLHNYYKLNSSKQNAKLQLFREKAIELKEKNQLLAEENKKLKLQLMETKETLSAYKPSMFGLFKFTGKKKRR